MKGDSSREKELATHPLPTFGQSVSGHSMDLFSEIEITVSCGGTIVTVVRS